ncbi:DMT family transporter [Chlorogloea sp. CCALA 695]|uniref:DMT family transporter n=1 Tax=Chlorogloea sp. CCALA 695 TaxID=2107693 RepID=UPI000D075C5E|nr:EamA family transporter [Chlorogloea sp. CCALA 695]PSB34553.1 EamA family transporter [Chlorogloea sp. CCALA 695]
MQLKLTDSKWLANLLLISPFFFWGTAMVAMKAVIPNTTPLFMAGVRLVPAGVLVLIVAAILGKPQPKGWVAWLWIALFALVDGTMFQGFLAEGLNKTGAGLGSVMIDSQPLAVAILALWLFGDRIGLWGFIGLVIGVLGISLIGLPDQLILNFLQKDAITLAGSWEQLFASGEWLMLLAALSMAVGTILIRYVCRYTDPVVATGWHMILGGLPLLALSSGVESQQWVNIDLAGWMALGYATIFGSAVAYGLFFYFASSGSLTSLSSLTFLTPIFALFFGNLFLGEFLSPLQWAGVGLTLVSIYLVNQREKLAAANTSLAEITSQSQTESQLKQAIVSLKEPETLL